MDLLCFDQPLRGITQSRGIPPQERFHVFSTGFTPLAEVMENFRILKEREGFPREVKFQRGCINL
jgi:hypothetical protein